MIQTPEQQMYLARLMGYDYTIMYRSGSSNKAVDAFSRLPESSSTNLMFLSVPCLTFLQELRQQLNQNNEFVQLRQSILDQPDVHQDFSVTNDLILHKGRIWLPQALPFTSTLLSEYHFTPTGGHMGIAKTLARLTENFYWKGIRQDVERFIASCVDCQHTKYETRKPAGLLCPLPIPLRPWEDLSLDFITGLPVFQGHTVILVVLTASPKAFISKCCPRDTLHTRWSFSSWISSKNFMECPAA